MPRAVIRQRWLVACGSLMTDWPYVRCHFKIVRGTRKDATDAAKKFLLTLRKQGKRLGDLTIMQMGAE